MPRLILVDKLDEAAQLTWLDNKTVLRQLGLSRQRLKYLRQTHILPSRLVHTWPLYPADYIEGLATITNANPSIADLACYLIRQANTLEPIDEIRECARIVRAHLMRDNNIDDQTLNDFIAHDWARPVEVLQVVPTEHRELVTEIFHAWQQTGLIDRFYIMTAWHIRRAWIEILDDWASRKQPVSEETLLAHCAPYLQAMGRPVERRVAMVHTASQYNLDSDAAAGILGLSRATLCRHAKRGLVPGRQLTGDHWWFAEADIRALKKQLDGLIPLKEVAAQLGFSMSRTRVLVQTHRLTVVRYAHGHYCPADEFARFREQLWHNPIDARITTMLHRKYRKKYHPGTDLAAKNVARRLKRGTTMVLTWARQGLLPHWEICLGGTDVLRRRFPGLYIEELLRFTQGRPPTKQDAIVFRQHCLNNIAP